MLASRARPAWLSSILVVGCGSGGVPSGGETAAQAAPAGPAARAQTPPEGRTVFDFAVNRVSAHVFRDGELEIDCGSPTFLKYALGGWRTGWVMSQRDEGRRVAFVAGVAASIQVPLDGDPGGPGLADVRLRATLRPVPARQRVSVFVNEQLISNVDLVSGWQTLDLPIGAHVRAGENALRFYFRGAADSVAGRSAAAFERISIVPASGRPGWRFSYYLQIPEGVALWTAPGFRVQGAKAEEAARPVEGGVVAALSGEAVRLDFLTDRAEPIEARLVAAAPARAAPARSPVKHVFIWMIDTLRPDRVGCYNPKTRVKTPSLDAFAGRGVLFKNATVQGNWSLTSHASLLSGVYPAVHKGYTERTRIRDEIDMAGEIFSRGGFTTATFLSNGYVSDSWGFGQGWRHYRNFIRESRPSDAKALWSESLAWLKKRKPEERLFVYFGTIDPHVIYNPPAEYLAMYDADSYSGIVKPTMTGLLLGKIKTGKATLNDRDKRRLEALYDGEITFSDFWFGRMQQDLAALGMLDDSVIVVVSDHGDEFYEHGSVGHGHSVFEELVATPLLMAGRGLPSGRQVGVDVEALDVLPTVMELAGLPASPAIQGESLLPLVDQDGPQAARPAFSDHGGTLRGMKIGRYKLISSGPEQTRLYDLREDPREQRDVSSEQPLAARHARDVFGLHMANEERWSKSRWGVPSNLRPDFASDAGL